MLKNSDEIEFADLLKTFSLKESGKFRKVSVLDSEPHLYNLTRRSTFKVGCTFSLVQDFEL